MKNLLISIVAALILCVSASASADTTYERRTDVAKLVIKTKKGYELLRYEWPTTVTTLLKTCNGDQRYICAFQITNGKEIALRDDEGNAFRFRDDGVWMSYYDTRHIVASR